MSGKRGSKYLAYLKDEHVRRLVSKGSGALKGMEDILPRVSEKIEKCLYIGKKGVGR